MKKLLLITLFFPLSSFALFEARLTYGGIVSTADGLSDFCSPSICTGTIPDIVPMYGLGADAIIKLPLIPFGFGLRYEKLGLAANSDTINADLKLNRTAILINYRLIDTILHVGPILSYGINHSGSVTMSQNGGTVIDYSSDKAVSYTLGLEVGIKPLIVIPIAIGAEAGLSSVILKDAVDASGNGATRDIDLSGYYLKVFMGLDI